MAPGDREPWIRVSDHKMEDRLRADEWNVSMLTMLTIDAGEEDRFEGSCDHVE